MHLGILTNKEMVLLWPMIY